MTSFGTQVGGLVRQHTKALQHQLGSIANRAIAVDSTETAAAARIGLYGNRLGVAEVVGNPIHLNRVCSRTIASRGNVTAVIGIDSHPLDAAYALRVGSVRTIVVDENLQFALYCTDTTGPFPHITDRVSNTAGAVVVVPSQRSGAGSGASGLAASARVDESRDCLIELLRTVLAVVVVAQRDKALHLADAHQQTPLHAGHAVPAVTFCLAVAAGLVKVHACGRVNAGQTVRTAILHDVQIL